MISCHVLESPETIFFLKKNVAQWFHKKVSRILDMYMLSTQIKLETHIRFQKGLVIGKIISEYLVVILNMIQLLSPSSAALASNKIQ